MKLVIGTTLMLVLVGVVHQSWGRVADEKCEEYSKLFRQRRDISSFFYSFFHVPKPEKEATGLGEFPHMAHLGFGDESDITYACGGILISDQYVLTTATCTTVDVLFLHNTRRRRATKAEHKSESSEETEEPESSESEPESEPESESEPEDVEDIEDDEEQEDDEEEKESLPRNSTIKWVHFGDKSLPSNLYLVEEVIIHPDHSSAGLYNDIALVKLDRQVEFTPDVRPACLYTKDDDLINKTVIATGWGATAFDQDLSEELMKINLVVLTEEECNKLGMMIIYFNDGLDDSQLCVGGREKPNTLCQGDGGGPLQIKNKEHSDMFDIVGLISFGYMCNVLSLPVYATRVSSFAPWIESVVWPEER